MTIKAIIRDGRIQPLEPLPTNWAEGQELVVEQPDLTEAEAEIAEWAKDLDAQAALLPAEEHSRFSDALDEIERQKQGSDPPRVETVVTSGYLLDTNHVGHAVMPDSTARRRIKELRAVGKKIGTCIPVLCEIESGIQQVRQPDLYRLNLDRLLRQVRIWPIDRTTAQLYGEIYFDLRRRGRVLSQVDIILVAMARQMNVTLVTSDQDFAAVPDVVTENWLTMP